MRLWWGIAAKSSGREWGQGLELAAALGTDERAPADDRARLQAGLRSAALAAAADKIGPLLCSRVHAHYVTPVQAMRKWGCVADQEGFEPTTSGFGIRCSTS